MEQNPVFGFRAHLLESIHINRIRKPLYAKISGRRSLILSTSLICWGKILLPVANYFDRKSRDYNANGIGIIAHDFIPMDHIASFNAKPVYRNLLKFRTLIKVFSISFLLRRSVSKGLKGFNFLLVHSIISNGIERIGEVEKLDGVHISLVKHILESAAFAAKNAAVYSESGDYGVKSLASSFIRVQMMGTILSPFIDRAASKFHRKGIGILVNDIPEIPYR